MSYNIYNIYIYSAHLAGRTSVRASTLYLLVGNHARHYHTQNIHCIKNMFKQEFVEHTRYVPYVHIPARTLPPCLALSSPHLQCKLGAG